MRKPCLLAIVLTLLGSPAFAQAKGDVIVPPPAKQDGSVVTPPAAHTDPGIQAPPPPNQGQRPDSKDKDPPKEAPSTTRP
jgi:hypothetical protein